MKVADSKPYTILVFSIGLLILAFPLFSKGMFMDGTIYAAVASNLSQGNGSLWAMKFSETIMNPFYEHPPLAIWMEVVFHKLFGDSFLSERIYSLFMWLLNGWLITLIWKELKPSSKIGWVPLLLWICIPIVTWSFSNNMLENTMGVFVSGSVFFFLKGRKGRYWLWSLMSGAMLALAFFSKGFVGLFPLILPALYAVFFFKERSIAKHLFSGVLVIAGFGLLMLPFVVSESGFSFLKTYFDHQVKNSVESVQTVPHRFKILEYFFLQMFVPLAIGVAVFFTAKDKSSLEQENRRWTGLFTLLVLCGVLPIMISLKQRDFYILTVYPFVALGIVLYMENGFIRLHQRLVEKISKPYHYSLVLLAIAIALSITATNYYKRDKDIALGAEKLAGSEFYGQTFYCSNNVRYDWGAMAYLSRFAKISVTRNEEAKLKLMFSNEENTDEVERFEGFKLVLNKD